MYPRLAELHSHPQKQSIDQISWHKPVAQFGKRKYVRIGFKKDEPAVRLQLEGDGNTERYPEKECFSNDA